MSSQREERLAKAWRKPLIVGLGTGPRTPNQLSDSIKELRKWGIELTKEEEKEARDIAIRKRDNLEEFLASFAKVLEKARIKESIMDKKGRKEALEKIKELREKFDIEDDELLSVTRVETPIEQKVEERKKEAVEKRIIEKAIVIVQELGGADVISGGNLYRFRNKNLKIETERSSCRSPQESLRGHVVSICARRKGKVFKELVFNCLRAMSDRPAIGIKVSKITVYKAGEWEKFLEVLYKKALAHRRGKEETRKVTQEQELAEDFNL